MKLKPHFIVLLSSFLIFASSCVPGGDNSKQLGLLYLFANYEVPADIYFDLGFPGSANSVVNDSFSGSVSDYSVTIGGEPGTGLTFTDPTTLEFTMPLLPGVNENTNVTMTIMENGLPFLEKTVRYRSLAQIPINQPHAFSNMISALDQSNFYTFTVGTGGDHIFNIVGYSFTDLDIYYKTSTSAASVPIAQNSMMNTEFKKFNISAGTYILEVRYVSGARTRNYMQIANGQISAVSIFNEVTTEILCYEFLSGGSTPTASNCYDQNNGNANYTRTGRCTYPSAGGLTTRSYYIRMSDGFGFTTGYAQATCTIPGGGSYNEADAIFENN